MGPGYRMPTEEFEANLEAEFRPLRVRRIPPDYSDPNMDEQRAERNNTTFVLLTATFVVAIVVVIVYFVLRFFGIV